MQVELTDTRHPALLYTTAKGKIFSVIGSFQYLTAYYVVT